MHMVFARLLRLLYNVKCFLETSKYFLLLLKPLYILEQRSKLFTKVNYHWPQTKLVEVIIHGAPTMSGKKCLVKYKLPRGSSIYIHTFITNMAITLMRYKQFFFYSLHYFTFIRYMFYKIIYALVKSHYFFFSIYRLTSTFCLEELISNFFVVAIITTLVFPQLIQM